MSVNTEILEKQKSFLLKCSAEVLCSEAAFRVLYHIKENETPDTFRAVYEEYMNKAESLGGSVLVDLCGGFAEYSTLRKDNERVKEDFPDDAEWAKSLDATAILSDDVINKIFSAPTPAEQVRLTSVLRDRAAELKKKTEFEKILKIRQKETLAGDVTPNNVTAFSGSSLTLNCGSWSCVGSTVRKQNADGGTKLVCTTPVMPELLLNNIENSTQRVRLGYRRGRRWVSTAVDREILANKNKIVGLSNLGININSTNAVDMVSYFSDLISLNEGEALESRDSVSHLGWTGTDFLPYSSAVTFDGDESVSSAVKTKGTLDEWTAFVAPLRENIYLRMQMAASFASPLLEPLSANPFILHLWGGTGTGKTVGLMCAVSVWGNPDVGKLTRTMDMTVNAMMTIAGALHSLPLAGDELQAIKKHGVTYDALIMRVTEGSNRARLRGNGGLERVTTWRNAFLFTGEEPITSDASGGGAKNRVLEIEVEGGVVEDGRTAARFLRGHYGAAGEAYMERVKELDLPPLYDAVLGEILSLSDASEKQASALAACVLADRIASDLFFKGEKPLDLSEVCAFLASKDTVDIAARAEEFTRGLIAENWKRFQNSGFGEIWGAPDDGGGVYINKNVLVRELRDGGFSFDAVKKGWAKSGFLRTNSEGRYAVLTSVGGVKSRYVLLAVNGSGDDIVDPDESDLPPF